MGEWIKDQSSAYERAKSFPVQPAQGRIEALGSRGERGEQGGAGRGEWGRGVHFGWQMCCFNLTVHIEMVIVRGLSFPDSIQPYQERLARALLSPSLWISLSDTHAHTHTHTHTATLIFYVYLCVSLGTMVRHWGTWEWKKNVFGLIFFTIIWDDQKWAGCALTAIM